MKTNMKTKVALLVIVLFLTSLVSFGIGRHGKHQRHGKSHKQEMKCCDNQKDLRVCKFSNNREFKGKEGREFKGREFKGREGREFKGIEFSNHKDFNHKKFNREMIKNHKNRDLSYNTILLEEVIVYGKRI